MVGRQNLSLSPPPTHNPFSLPYLKESKQRQGEGKEREGNPKKISETLSVLGFLRFSVGYMVTCPELWDLIHGQVPGLAFSHSACPSHTMMRRETFLHIVEATFHSFVEKSSKATGNAKVFPKLLSSSQMMILSNLGNGVVLPSNSLSSPLTQQVFLNPSLCAQAGGSSMQIGMTTPGLGELAAKGRVKCSRAGLAVSRCGASVPGESPQG